MTTTPPAKTPEQKDLFSQRAYLCQLVAQINELIVSMDHSKPQQFLRDVRKSVRLTTLLRDSLKNVI